MAPKDAVVSPARTPWTIVSFTHFARSSLDGVFFVKLIAVAVLLIEGIISKKLANGGRKLGMDCVGTTGLTGMRRRGVKGSARRIKGVAPTRRVCPTITNPLVNRHVKCATVG